ncbi:receptor kinase-like protein Xa21 [Salvia hispanica]|uniref:receptor kinase-like protein Xa21 n=1 Tax=Salvia hispanica TaxID=49212 RepID=UPI0020091CCA|nr:receptor kinase-like protein Xa21 [Salvia hispanica]
MVVPDPKEPVPVLDPKAPTLDPLKDPKEPLKVEPTDPLEDDPTVGPKGFVNPHDNVDEEVNPGVGTIVGIGPVFAMVEEMMAVVVAGLVAAAVLDSVDISSKGNIPSSIGGCQLLESLYLSNNLLDGPIPQSLGNVRNLNALDLSYNNLSESIPKSLEDLRFLEYFNVSNNKLVGEIPDRGCFGNLTDQSFSNNLALCGPIRFKVPPCTDNHHRSKSLMIFIVPSVILAVTMSREPVVLVRATFLEEEVFCSVFEATLSDGLKTAVKVFNLQLQGAERSFDTETEILGSIRHRNIVRVIGCCSSPEFKALVLTYLPKGSLDKWLYPNIHCLDLIQRLKIGIDVATALEYLHHGHTFPVVHRDVKPNNVLLDQDMVAHLGDFGIGKLFGDGEVVVQTQTLATIGYAAPELGMEGKVSTHGDVYSFGMMLLEMFTGKKPTDDMFDGEMRLKEWLKVGFLEGSCVTDPTEPEPQAKNGEGVRDLAVASEVEEEITPLTEEVRQDQGNDQPKVAAVTEGRKLRPRDNLKPPERLQNYVPK